MVGITLATIAVALRGEPSTIALAHFAALTQGLQLLDARPRRTEFLLVALALFQVVLAANLTDSVFFPPLLVAFVGSAVWTLLVHTLRSEAIEAGDPREVPRAITPGLLRMTLVASALSVVLALALFVPLPRLRSSVITGSGVSPLLASAGFSERVELGDLGRIRQDPTLALRVETLEGKAPARRAAPTWRGLAFDTFDGRSWSIVPPAPLAGRRQRRGRRRASGASATACTSCSGSCASRSTAACSSASASRAGSRAPCAASSATATAASTPRARRDERVRYTRRRASSAPGATRLSRQDALRAGVARRRALPPAPAALARGRRAGAPRSPPAPAATPSARARSSATCARTGRYTDTPPPLGADGRARRSRRFLLGELAGHCEYFASAMVVLARALGLPARLVNGFAGGRENGIGGFVELTRSDAHTWVEVHFERAGWVRYDPTPPDLRARPDAGALARDACASSGARSSSGGSRASSASTARTRSTPPRAPGSPGRAPSALAARPGAAARRCSRGCAGTSPGARAALLACAALAGALGAPGPAPPARRGAAGRLRGALRLLSRRGLVRPRSDRARLPATRRRRPSRRGARRLRTAHGALSRGALRRPTGAAGRSASCARCGSR